MKTIAVLMGGPSTEHEVSLASGKNVCDNLDREKYNVLPVKISKKGSWCFGTSTRRYSLFKGLVELQRKKVDVAFIALHGSFGEDGQLQSLLEVAGIHYTGSNSTTSGLAMDKQLSGLLFRSIGLRVPSFTTLRKGQKSKKTILPVVIKPRFGGSSVGITIVRNPRAFLKGLRNAWRHEPGVIIQQYITGVEVTCGIVESLDGKPQALPPTLIRSVKTSFFDYKAKYTPCMSEEITPAPLSKPLLKKIQAQALLAHVTLGCRGFSRSDFILHGNKIYILETNTIPGLTTGSLLPKAAKVGCIPFPQLLDRLILSALKK
jgi:D-alanine-D-alanine ligase